MTETIREWNPAEGDLCQGDVLLLRLPEGWTPALTDTVLPLGILQSQIVEGNALTFPHVPHGPRSRYK